MEQSPSLEANRPSASQQIPRILWNLNVHYRIHKRPPPALSVSWARSIQSMPPHPNSWKSMLILSFHQCLGLSNLLFPSGLPTKTLYVPFVSRARATCSVHLMVLNLITQIICGEECKPWSSSLCSLLYTIVSSSFFGPNRARNILDKSADPLFR
jgi:hypothetical protein